MWHGKSLIVSIKVLKATLEQLPPSMMSEQKFSVIVDMVWA